MKDANGKVVAENDQVKEVWRKHIEKPQNGISPKTGYLYKFQFYSWHVL